MEVSKEAVKRWLKESNKDRHWLAEQCEVEKRTVDNWLSTSGGIPPKAQIIIANLISAHWERLEAASDANSTSAALAAHASNRLQDAPAVEYGAPRRHDAPSLTPAEWGRVKAMAERNGQSVADWLATRVHDYFSFFESQRPQLMAAAGDGIEAEVMEWEPDATHINVQLHGESMMPIFKDGQVVRLRLKSTSRSPFMRKGLLYLVRGASGYRFKRYNTRPATAEEIENEANYIYTSPIDQRPKVRVLESINPDFPESIISDSESWVAWLER